MKDLQFPKAAPTTRDLMDRVKYDVAREINCHLIAKIESIDLAKNTIEASSAFKRRMSNGDEIDYPLFIDVPLLVPHAGDAFWFLPPKVGDWCLLEFNDRDIDSWWYAGSVASPNSPRAHSLADGLAIVGIRPSSNPLTLTDDAATLSLAAYQLRLKNDVANLKTLVDSLIDAILGIKPIVATLGVPGVIDPASITLLNSIKVQFGTLLKE